MRLKNYQGKYLSLYQQFLKSGPDDVFKPQKTKPDPADYEKLIKQTQDKLKEKTGYELRARPAGLSPKKTRAQIRERCCIFQLARLN